MIFGETESDPWSMDIARYGDFASNREYIKQTTGQFYSRRFVMSYPNEQLPAGRDLKRTAVWDVQKNNGQYLVTVGGWKYLLFWTKKFQETPSLKRSNAFEIVKKSTLM